MSVHEMVLYPKSPYAGLEDQSGFIHRLQETGFLGKPTQWLNWSGRSLYGPGVRFAEYIQFSGNPPTVTVKTENGYEETPLTSTAELVSEIDVTDVTDKPGGVAGENTIDPVCRFCLHSVEDWPTVVSRWHDQWPNYEWICPICGRMSTPDQWDWKRTAAFARYFIIVEGIFERGAEPTERFLGMLQDLTAEAWDYCFVHL